jgi:hypothetical protein
MYYSEMHGVCVCMDNFKVSVNFTPRPQNRSGNSARIHTDHEVHPASCTMGTVALSPGVKRLGCDNSHPPPSDAEVGNE